jgi:hypothetical protein
MIASFSSVRFIAIWFVSATRYFGVGWIFIGARLIFIIRIIGNTGIFTIWLLIIDLSFPTCQPTLPNISFHYHIFSEVPQMSIVTDST